MPRNLPPDVSVDQLRECPHAHLQEAVFSEIQFLHIEASVGLDSTHLSAVLYCASLAFGIAIQKRGEFAVKHFLSKVGDYNMRHPSTPLPTKFE